MFLRRPGCPPSPRLPSPRLRRCRAAPCVETALSPPNEMGLNGVASLLRTAEWEPQQQQPRR